MHKNLRKALIEQVSSMAAALQRYPVKGLASGVGSSLTDEEFEALSNVVIEERVNLRIKAPYMELLQLYAAFHPAMDLLYKAAAAKAEVKDEDVASFIINQIARGIGPLRNMTKHLFRSAIQSSKDKDALYHMDVAFLSEVLAYSIDKECKKADVKKDGRVLEGQTESNNAPDGAEDLETFCRRIKRSVTAYALVIERLRKKEGRRDADIYADLENAGALLYENTEYVSIPVMPASQRAVYRDASRAYNSDRKRHDRIVAALKDELEGVPTYNKLMAELKALKARIKAAEAKGGIKYRYMVAQQPYADAYKHLGYNVVLKNSEYYVRLPRVLGSLDKVIGEDDDGNAITGHDRVTMESADHRARLIEEVNSSNEVDFFALMAYFSNTNGAAKSLYKGFAEVEKADAFEVRCNPLTLTGGAKFSADTIINGVLLHGKAVSMGIFKDLSKTIAVEHGKKELDEDQVRKVFRSALGLIDVKGHCIFHINWYEFGRKLRLDAAEYQELERMTRYIKYYRGKHNAEQLALYAQQVADYKAAVKQARLAERRNNKAAEAYKDLRESVLNGTLEDTKNALLVYKKKYNRKESSIQELLKALQSELKLSTAVEFPEELTEELKEYRLYSRTVARRKALMGNRGKYEYKYRVFIAKELRKLIK